MERSSSMSEPARGKDRTLLIAAAFAAFTFCYMSFWVFWLYPALINDEYAALDFVYRTLKTGALHLPPHVSYKPYSLIFGLAAFAGGPLTYELINAAFAAALVLVFYLVCRQKLSQGFAALSAVMLIFAVDLFDDVVRGTTIVPGTLCLLAAVLSAPGIEEEPGRWKKYSLFGFLGGFARPESWLLAFPLLWWLFPRSLKLRQLARWIAGPAIIALSAVIWFGKDWFLARNVLYSLEVAQYQKMIGTGKPFTLLECFYWFHQYLSRKLSVPFEIFCYIAFCAYFWENRRRALKDPLIILPVLLFLFLTLLTWLGSYPQMRYFTPLGVFLLIYAGWLLQKIYRFFKSRGRQWPALAAVGLITLEYFLWSGYRTSTAEYKALKRESEVQRQVGELADYFRPLLSDGPRQIMISDRRDDQFGYLLRDLPMQNYFCFREGYYYEKYKGKDFLGFEPEWILWLPDDYQYRGVNDMFTWLNYQDNTELSGRLISLQKTIGDFRIFKVTAADPP